MMAARLCSGDDGATGRPIPRPGGGPGKRAHVPVLLEDVLAALRPQDGKRYLDCTFGAGGYSSGLLDAADCTVWGVDRDPTALAAAAPLQRRHAGRLHLMAGRFGDLEDLAARHGLESLDGIAFDFGVSSMQLERPERGFSFRTDGPLDMRMDEGASGTESAADAVNRLPEENLADILFHYGEERRARQVARAIVEARRDAPIETTLQLAEIVRKVVRRSRDGIDPATRTFQALRVHVNDELREIDRGLAAAERLLAPGGVLAAVSFHSLEDRRVKAFLQDRSGQRDRGSRHLPAAAPDQAATFEVLHRSPRRPSAAERQRNPRARSARLRAARRTDAEARS